MQRGIFIFINHTWYF